MVALASPVFPDGSITRIIYHNFLTFDDVESRPGPNLNVIIGANGTGKSTVICGICLAVGGNPKVLGRSERFGDYIKHKRDQGFVELSIADSQKGEQRVKILLERPNSCTYFINGSRVTQRAVRELAASYNIQVDNPCTFLAQDKVKSFSEQSPVDLLFNTERAGNLSSLQKHEELIEKKRYESVHLKSVRETEQRLHTIEAELAALSPLVQNYETKEFLRTKIEILEKKKAILDFHECMRSYAVAEETVDRLQGDVDETQKQVDDLQKESENCSKKESEHVTEDRETLRQIREITNEVNALKNNNLYSEKVRHATERFDRVKAQKDKWEQELNQMKTQVDNIREGIVEAKKALDGYEDFKKDALQKAQKIADEEDSLYRMEEELSVEDKKICDEKNRLRDEERSLNEVLEGRLRVLESLRSNMSEEAWRWYEANRDKFRYPVFVPILHMTVRDARSAMLLENLVPFRDMPMFIFGCKEDETLLTDRRHTWKLNSTVMPPSQVDLSKLKTELTPELKELGFTQFAVDLFDSVDVVKQYLCNVAKLHQVLIGSSKTNDLYDTVKTTFVKNSYRLYLTDKYRVQFTVSKYGNHEILGQQSELKTSARIFIRHSKPLDDRSRFQAEAQRIRDRESDLRSRRLELDKSRRKIQMEKEELKKQQAEWVKRREILATCECTLSSRERKLEDLMANRPDIDQAYAALKETRINATKEVYENAMKLLSKLDELRMMSVRGSFLKVVLKHLHDERTKVDEELKNCQEKLEDQMSQLQSQKELFDIARNNLTRMTERLQDKCALKTLKPEEMNAEEKEVLRTLEKLFVDEAVPDDMSMLVQLLEEERVRLNIAAVDGRKEDVERSELLKRERIDLLSRKEQQEAAREAWNTSLLKEITEWREPIEKLIREINVNYSKFFAEIGCAGEIFLHVPEDPLNIAEYGIMVMVSFRQGERLRRLDHQVQSGGERSVATMLYLLALQELCPVPFRCVDEINQGMDAVNERKVCNLIADILDGEGNLSSTQYFLLTPKLLHELKFNRKVTVQIVQNGPTLTESHRIWDMRKFIAAVKSRSSL
ncbi:hypothetical protein KIN20_036584 [Parelaphostrongylus tenuis]|uniref:Structural maintenance of chromosomes protein 5 n=1 Tax=Parelaphostrongylus tenuis TaxID=148309 RepID=A0AAD5WKP8_PARTN|nr:hypothetical protein KIN20_036584 [Parelaphostrongylus tenuis]